MYATTRQGCPILCLTHWRVLNRIKKAFYKLRLIQLKCIKEEEMNVPTADEKMKIQ